MSNVHPLLPRLTVNRRFMGELLSADDACCALGLVEERKLAYGCVALRLDAPLPPLASKDGFGLGHRLLGTDEYEAVQFSFDFHGAGMYHVVLNPGSPVVQQVLGLMLARDDYFILVIGDDDNACAFRADTGQESLAGLKPHLPRIRNSTTTETQYGEALAAFERNPSPPGRVLEWLCRDDVSCLDLTTGTVELRPE
jgi:hypothetical protein